MKNFYKPLYLPVKKKVGEGNEWIHKGVQVANENVKMYHTYQYA